MASMCTKQWYQRRVRGSKFSGELEPPPPPPPPHLQVALAPVAAASELEVVGRSLRPTVTHVTQLPLAALCASVTSAEGFEMEPAGKVARLKLEPGRKWNALVISDLHIAAVKSYFSKHSQELAMSALPGVVARERAEQLVVLGDVFHGEETPSRQLTHQTIAALAQGGHPLFVIGGNHDRDVFATYGKELSATYSNVSIFSELMLCIETPTSKIYLTHDGGNPYRVAHHQIGGFLDAMREVNHMRPADLLVCGHTHASFDLLESKRQASIGCFTAYPERGKGLQYGTLREDAHGALHFKLGCAADTL
eukprot:TRINITY_DN866_c0_g1_i7.p1 TRINITY_DN866_c0_g1~~TRINITY_DN866_c0_g1_i7.p1  ORF type:complete len:308 (-),score=66.57 TRINITY_DN866_c0_g1_i7:77-1000(-)